MKTILSLFFLGSSVLVSAQGFSTETSTPLVPQKTYRFQPCSYWRYDAGSASNTCVFTDNTIEVTDAQDVAKMQKALLQLQQTVESLEKRVKTLEDNH